MRTYSRGHTRHITIPPEAWELAARPYTILYAHDSENGYVGRVEEFPWLVIAENSLEALYASLRKAIALSIAVDLRRGQPIPDPTFFYAV